MCPATISNEDLNIQDVMPDWDSLMETVKDQPSSLPPPPDEPMHDVEYWKNVFNDMQVFAAMDLMVAYYQPQQGASAAREHIVLRKTIKDFLPQLVENNLTDLQITGVDENGLSLMKKGILPEGFTVHLKYPSRYGGKIEFDNMVLIKSRPFHEYIHQYINMQLVAQDGQPLNPSKLYLPVPIGSVYIPPELFTGSGGVNNTMGAEEKQQQPQQHMRAPLPRGREGR